MRIAALCLATALATPAFAELRPDGTTALLGLGLTQNGTVLPLEQRGMAYVVSLAPGAFMLTFPGQVHEVVAITFGPEGIFDLLDLPPETGLFGPGSAYAREEGPEAAHFMTDPLCTSPSYGPGFNYLDATRATAEGYPVAALQVDSASRTCKVAERLPGGVNLLGRVNPLYAVVRTDAGIERLILQFVGS